MSMPRGKRRPSGLAFHELVVDAAPTAMVVSNARGGIVLVNEAAERLFGYGRAELLGKPVETLVPSLLHERHRSERTAFLAAPSTRVMGAGRELFALRKDGSEVPVEIGLNPVESDQGTLVLSAIIDLTERKRADARFRLAVEAAPNAMLMVDPHGAIVLVNSQAEHLFGYARHELVGSPIELLVPERIHHLHPSFRHEFIAAPQTRAMGAGRDLFALRKDGSEIPVEIGLNPIAMADGVYVLSSVIDITERKRAEEEREALLLEARAASQAKDDFLATLSHELRTPLNAILGWASLLQHEDVATPEAKTALETIERNARHQARIIGEVLDVSRIVQGRFRLDVANCDLGGVVASVMASLGPAARAKQIVLRSSIEAMESFVADSGRLEQVVWNLVSNAIKFTPKGGHVQVDATHAGSHVCLVVRDDGKGIPTSFLPHVFERFTQADTSSTREHGGLGLGLAIARHLVELHGGSISVRSSGDGQGSVFTVRLPIAPPAEIRPPWLASVPQILDAPPASLANLRILVVDDEPDTLEVLRHGLERFGAAVVAADSVDSAIAALGSFPADVIVTDVAMPNRDGFALLRSLHAEPEAPSARIPLIALTAYASSEDRQHALDAGFKLHVSKPVEPRRLAQLIAQVVRANPQPIVVQ